MLALRDLRGLKCPDEFLVRFFFKRGHDSRPGRVVELGCGNGVNLMLYRAYSWDITGVDISAAALDAARHNLEGQGNFLQHDLAQGLPALGGTFDVILMPSSMYYIPRDAFMLWLRELPRLKNDKADLYLRMRLPDDYRFGKGSLVERNAFRLAIAETGEAGCLNVFYDENELKTMLIEQARVAPKDIVVLKTRYDNLQSGVIVANSEVVIWATIA